MLEHHAATFPTITMFMLIVISLLAFAVSAVACNRSGHMFIAAFLAAGAWLFAAALALLAWLTFRR
jgi:hypothetical protein